MIPLVNRKKTMKKKVGYLGVYLALALILSYVESLIPFYFGVPGMKLGLTNCIVVLMLYLTGPGDAFLVSVLRIILAGFMFGNAFSILYSLAGGLVSFFIMYLFKQMHCFHMITISILGGISHNLGQILVACFVISNFNLLFYFPFLLVGGMMTGACIGVISRRIFLRIRAITKSN